MWILLALAVQMVFMAGRQNYSFALGDKLIGVRGRDLWMRKLYE